MRGEKHDDEGKQDDDRLERRQWRRRRWRFPSAKRWRKWTTRKGSDPGDGETAGAAAREDEEPGRVGSQRGSRASASAFRRASAGERR